MNDPSHSMQIPALPEPYKTALAQALDFILERFEVLGLVAAGSILRGRPDASSDLDLYVIHAGTFRQRIQRFFNGVPAEIFANPPRQIERYLEEEQKDRRPLTAHMLATGFVILQRDPLVEALRSKARARLANPPQADAQQLTYARYLAATSYEDARDVVEKDPETANMLLSQAVVEMLHYLFRREGRFLPRQKELLDRAAGIDAETGALARRFFDSSTLVERLPLAQQIATRTIATSGFFEWESEPEEIN